MQPVPVVDEQSLAQNLAWRWARPSTRETRDEFETRASQSTGRQDAQATRNDAGQRSAINVRRVDDVAFAKHTWYGSEREEPRW